MQAKAGVPQMMMTDPRLAATQPESGLVTLNGDPGHTSYPICCCCYRIKNRTLETPTIR